MKVVDDNIIRFERVADMGPVMTGHVGMTHDHAVLHSGGMVYAAQRLDRGAEHDGRGLTIAILLCMACWAALGYFVLA